MAWSYSNWPCWLGATAFKSFTCAGRFKMLEIGPCLPCVYAIGKHVSYMIVSYNVCIYKEPLLPYSLIPYFRYPNFTQVRLWFITLIPCCNTACSLVMSRQDTLTPKWHKAVPINSQQQKPDFLVFILVCTTALTFWRFLYSRQCIGFHQLQTSRPCD